MTRPTATTSDSKPALTPKLRFPEFRDEPDWVEHPLEELGEFVDERVAVSALNRADYVSTENLLPDFGGFATPSSFPSGGSVVRYRAYDILAANIPDLTLKKYGSQIEVAEPPTTSSSFGPRKLSEHCIFPIL